MSPRSPLLRPALAVLAAGALLNALHVGLGVGGWRTGGSADDSTYTAVEVLATLLVGARVLARRSDRLGWGLLGAYLALWTIGDLGWTLHYDGVAHPPFPNWTDAAYLVSYGCAYAGLTLLLRQLVRSVGASQWLDGLIGGLALAALCGALFYGAVVDHTSGAPLTVAVTLAYPALDVLLLCLLGVGFAAMGWRAPRCYVLLGAALTVLAVGDSAYCYQEAVGTYSAGSWVNATWPLSMAMIALAAWCPTARLSHHVQSRSIVAVPALFGVLALGLLTWSVWHPLHGAAALLAVAALFAAGARTVLTHRENMALLRRSRVEALTDNLTGLGNRRRLMVDLDEALRAAADGQRTTLALFDLDGFKGYNDTFGHGAGDALLTRLGGALAAAVRGEGAAYRLGGDEFCVLLDCEATRDSALVRAAAEALAEHGEGFSIGSSFGVVRLPGDADSSTVALQLADERMYDDKDSRRGSPRRQARDLLMQVLKEREPGLEEHVDDVGALAMAVGRHLGLSPEQLDELARGAELHDVGKVAVPDTILHKPGPLDDVEWEIMRQHTIVGERILSAAPALRPVARLVRSSHERWDGRGYPDGLAGEEIPLGSRIIAVCDAFDAMRQERSYAPTMSEDDALAELRRCSGTQFAPDVVDALAVVLAQGAGRELRVA